MVELDQIKQEILTYKAPLAEVKESSALIQSKAYLIGHDLWHPEPFPAKRFSICAVSGGP